MKIDFKTWAIPAALLLAAALTIHFTTNAHPTRPLRPAPAHDHLAPLDYTTYNSTRRDLPADFERGVVITAYRYSSEASSLPPAELAVRWSDDAAYEIICLDDSPSRICRAPLRSELALILIDLWMFELTRIEPAKINPGPTPPTTRYTYSFRQADGKIRLGQADNTNESSLLNLTSLLHSYVLADPAHRPTVEQELTRVATAALAERRR